MSIYSKLMIVQQELKAPKGQYNSFGNYKYRSCEDILEAVKTLLKTNKLVLVLSDDLVNVGNRNYVKATATMTDIETGESISNSAFAREEETKKGMDGSQITGASSSYARKYALNGLFAIDDTKDSDATNTHDIEEKPVTSQNSELEQAKAYAFTKGNNLKKFGDYSDDELIHIQEWAKAKGNEKLLRYATIILQDREQAPFEV